MKRKKWEQRSRDYDQAFFTFQGQKSSVPSGCVLAGIRFVTALADMNNYPSRTVPIGCSAKTATQYVKYYINSASSAP